MARTNVRQVAADPKTQTHEGAPAARITPEQALRRSVMSCLLWENTFYEGGVEIGARIAQLAMALDPKVVANIATEAREQMYLRHAPLWLVRAMVPKGGRLVGDTLARVIQRPDELGEFLTFYWGGATRNQNGTGKNIPLAKQVKRGLAMALRKFDAYQLAKWDQGSAAVKLRDVIFLVHPKAKDAGQQEIWDKVVAGTLESPETWEVMLSSGLDKKATFETLLEQKKLGGLALLRNLRNMQQAGVDRALVISAIDEHPFPRILPFRFLTAARYAPDFEPVLERAMLRATASLEKLGGKTALLVDHSGSMQASLSQKSELSRFDAAAALAVLLREVCEDVDVITFSDDVVVVPARRGFGLIDAMTRSMHASSTMTEKAKRFADVRGYDRIIIVTDEQSHQALSAPQSNRAYVINVAPYQNGIGYGRWNHIDGWSENVVKWVAAYESEFDQTISELTNELPV